MKYTFDSEEIFTARKILWALVFLAVAVLIYHAGFMCGMHKAHKNFKHHMYQMRGQETMFDVRAPQGMMPMQMHGGQDVIYYNGNTMMGAGSAAAMPATRAIKMNQGGTEEQRVIYFKSQ